MREKVALELAAADDKQDFIEGATKGALNFPILCSVRINLVRKLSEDVAFGATEHTLNAVIVEATEQDLTIGAAIPNTSMAFLSELLKALPPDDDRMVVAPANQVTFSPHAGMVVIAQASKKIASSCVLTLVAHVGKSRVDDLPGGQRIVSKSCWNIPFTTTEESNQDAPQYADEKLHAQLASFCTMDNVQYYALSSAKGKDPVYALVVISSVTKSSADLTFMVDKVRIIPDKSQIPTYIPLLSKLATLSMGLEYEGTDTRQPPWDSIHRKEGTDSVL